jgi:phosphoribosylformimino-5-aminoimidazole carboxamide ribotide isomerase
MAEFEILAAIDLRGGRVVRLREGDFDQETRYSDDPVATAREMVGQGTRWFHVVDLDGARDGRPVQAELVKSIIDGVGDTARVEVGGGIRELTTAAHYLEAGAARIVLGTAALRGELAGQLIEAFGADRVVVALDVRGAQAVGGAWQVGGEATDVAVAIARLIGQGVGTLEVTAIDRDGTLLGPDLALLERVIATAPNTRVIASAGIRSINDLIAVRDLGSVGAIVGRAVYEGDLDLETAIAALMSPRASHGA